MSATASLQERPLGRPVRGPTALGDDPARFVRLTWTLAVTQFRLRFYGSVLGYLWQILRPLALFGVLYVVFSVALDLGDQVPFFPVMLLTGVVLYTFLNEATSASVTSVVDREALVRKVEFPRMVVPCSVVLTATFNLGLNLLVVVIFATAAGVDPQTTLVQAPLILAALLVFASGLALLVSVLYVRYRDVRPISDVGLQVLFYATPILYPIEAVPDDYQEWFMLNPLAVIVQQARHAFIDHGTPSAFAVGGWQVAVAGVLVAGTLVLGLLRFRASAPSIAEEL